MKKRVLSVLLAVALVVSMAVPAFAATVPKYWVDNCHFITCIDEANGVYQLDLSAFTYIRGHPEIADKWIQIKKDVTDPERLVIFDFYASSGNGFQFTATSLEKSSLKSYTKSFSTGPSIYANSNDARQIRCFVTYSNSPYSMTMPSSYNYDGFVGYQVATSYDGIYSFCYSTGGADYIPYSNSLFKCATFINSFVFVDKYPVTASHTLTVNYQYEDGSEAAPSTTQSLDEGASYSVPSPTVDGYTPDKFTVAGTMGTEDITETVVYSKTAHTLTIQYQFEGGEQAAPPETRSLTDGATYEVTSPAVVGYTPDRATVSGTMGAADKTETVTYEINSHVLTVNYQYEDGTQAAASSTNIVNYGVSYSVPSPMIAGYKPDRATVAGTMPDQDVTATVTYIGQSGNLTILYQYEDGSQAAPTYTAELAEGSSYEVRSPDIKGYTPDIEYVSGTVPEGGTTVTVTYKAVKYTLTIDYQYEDGTQAAETVTRSLASGERYEILSPTVDGYKPSTATVTGFMPSRDKVVLVTYAKDSSSSGGGSSSTPSGGGDWEYSDPWGEPSADFWNQLFGGYTFQGPFFSGSGGSGSGAGKRYPWDGLDQDALLGELLGDYEYHNPYPGGG